MDWKRNDIHRIVVFDACLGHVTSCFVPAMAHSMRVLLGDA